MKPEAAENGKARDQPPSLSLLSVALCLLLVLAGLPLAVWLDLRSLTEAQMADRADALSETIDDLRDFYAENVVARAVAHDGPVEASHRYFEISGAIPIPATFSLELVSIFDRDGDEMRYRFISDYPFQNRPPTLFSPFERRALDLLTQDPTAMPFESSGGLFDRSYSIATPILMGQACVDCHNSHSESPRQDWNVGDVRGIQAFTLNQHMGTNIFAFRFLLIYFAGLIGVAWFVLRRLGAQSRYLLKMNDDLGHANEFLAAVSMKVSRYISPKIYRRIFAGGDVDDVKTERRKLTIFFSDVQGFTELTERLQPEELTELLNEYFTEMAQIAEAHNGTLDKFVGDAVLVFFGDPVSHGVREDARAAMRMALAMQERIADLSKNWQTRGVEFPFQVRMGLNTGYCNVGDFGSQDRMSYTIIGAEVNLAARLQALCGPGEIAMAKETFAYVNDMVTAQPAGPIEVKGIAYPVDFYVVRKAGTSAQESINLSLEGLHLSFDPNAVSDDIRLQARTALQNALRQLESGQERPKKR